MPEFNRAAAAQWAWALGALLGIAYWAGAMARSDVAFDELSFLPPLLVLVWKCVATGLLATAAWLVATSRARLILACYMAAIWAADLVLGLDHITLSGAMFIAAHLIAIYGYWPARVPRPFFHIRTVISVSIPVSVMLIMFFCTRGTGISPEILFFPLFSSLNAMMAIQSRFPVWLNGLGAAIFILSDVIFVVAVANYGDVASVGWLVWFTYFLGLILVTRGLIVDAGDIEESA